MSYLVNNIDNQKPNKELEESLKELEYIENHLDEYKKYDNVDELLKDILNNK